MSVELYLFSDYIRFFRRHKKMTIRDIEKETGISNPMISQYETGRSEPSLRNAQLIARCLGFSLDEIPVPVVKKKKK